MGSNGKLTLTQGIADTGWVEAVAVGELSGTLTSKLSSVTALSVGEAFVTVNAGTDGIVFGGTEVIGTVHAYDVQVVSYGQLALGVVAAHDLWAFAGGNVAGLYYAGNSVRSFSSDGSINTTLTAGSGIPSGESDYGKIAGVSAWGDISGSITAAVSVGGVSAGGTVTAHVSVPAGQTVSITQGDSGLIGTLPVLGDVGQAALAAEVRGLIAQGQQLQSQLTQGAAVIQQQLSADQEGASQTYQMVVSEFSTARSQTLSALGSADAQTNATLNQARADDQTALGKVEEQISKITQQVQMQANAAQTSDNLSLSTAKAQIAASQQRLQLVSSAAATLKQGALQAESNFAAGLNQALVGGRAQHEIDWQHNLDKVMAALAENTLSAQISNGASYWWNIYVSLNLGQLQGVLNDLVLVGNTVIKSDELFLSPAGTDWLGKVFGITNLAIPSARGLIIDEPDWEYTWSQRFANAGIILVSLDLPIGGGGAAAEVAEGAPALNSAADTLGNLDRGFVRQYVADLMDYTGIYEKDIEMVPEEFIEDGEQIVGEYYPWTNTIKLYFGSTDATLVHELIHAAKIIARSEGAQQAILDDLAPFEEELEAEVEAEMLRKGWSIFP